MNNNSMTRGITRHRYRGKQQHDQRNNKAPLQRKTEGNLECILHQMRVKEKMRKINKIRERQTDLCEQSNRKTLEEQVSHIFTTGPEEQCAETEENEGPGN